jgi:hypothetical protein
LRLEVAPVRLLVLQELREVDDSVQRVVYLVRHARGQLAERGELRRLVELLLHLLALGLKATARREVADDEDYQALLVGRERVERDRDGRAAPRACLDDELAFARSAAVEQLVQRGTVAADARADYLAHVSTENLLRAVTENLAELVVGFRQAMVGGRDDAYAVVRVLEQCAVTLLALD